VESDISLSLPKTSVHIHNMLPWLFVGQSLGACIVDTLDPCVMRKWLMNFMCLNV